MTTETIVCYIIENRLGDIIGFYDTLEFAKAEAARLSPITGDTYRIIQHCDTNGDTIHTQVA